MGNLLLKSLILPYRLETLTAMIRKKYEVSKSANKISDILEHSRMDSSNESLVNRDPKVV